jgi:hypothetical protein
MTWKQKLTVEILLLVARMVSDDEWKAEIKRIATHISVSAPKSEGETA